ncbi:MAG: outer membrane protein assembly factor BamD [Thermodesulfobacteriota bacterium]
MDPIKRPLAEHLNASRLARLVLVLVAFTLLGCAGVNTVSRQSNPKELFDTGMQSYLDERYEEAETSFKTLLEEHPLGTYALRAQLRLGDTCYAMEKYDDASAYYTSFVSLHPMHPRAPYALFQKGMSHFKEVLSYDRDQTATKKALFAFEDLVATYPDSVYYARSKEFIKFLRRRLADREFYVAHFYFKSKNYKGALSRLGGILKDYPDEGITDKALYYIGESYKRLGEKKLSDETFATLIKEFPQSPFAREVKGLSKEG